MSNAPIFSAASFALVSLTAVLAFSSASEAQMNAALPPPLSITERYVPPPKEPDTARASLTLLVDAPPVVDASSTVASAPVQGMVAQDMVTQDMAAREPRPAAQPVVSEEVGNRSGIMALAPGRFAITVSSPEHR